MSDETQSFTFEQTVSAAPEAVYRAFTNATALREWLCDVATTAPRERGRCYLAWNDGYYSSGAFTRLLPGEEVAFSWLGPGEPASSSVRVTLTPEEESTRVRVVHGGIGRGPGWEEVVSALEKAWPLSLENLVSIFDSGADLRVTQRPMLGITVGDFDTEIAAQLEVPASEGIRLDGVVPEMGAGAAGLQENDVIVAVAGQPVTDWASLASVLGRHRAGDAVDVDYYRGPERKQARMTLSGRPIPEIPQSIEALGGAVRARYAQINEELREFFTGVTEEQAAHKPAPDAWSAREVLAHFIHGERGWHNWMAEMVSGHEPWYDDWGGNVQARIDATLAAFPSVDELLEELRRLNEETVAFAARLPERFPQERKASYWRLAYQLLEAPYHHRSHLEQMRQAVDAAP